MNSKKILNKDEEVSPFEADAVYMESLSDDLFKVAKEILVLAEDIRENGPVPSKEGKAVVNNIQKITTLFKKRFNW